MFRILLVCAAVLAASFALAAEPQAITVWRLESGYYVVSGSQIVAFPPGGPIVPPDGPFVPPVVPAGKAAAIKAAAEAAVADPQRATTASNLASVMGMVRSQVDSGTLKDYKSISASVNWLWDQLTTGKAAAWQPCKTLIGKHLAALAQEGARPEEYSGYLADAEKALSGSLTSDDRLSVADDPLAINMDTLMKLFEFFVKFILPYIIKI
jgi:hypothetical protein